MRPGLPELVAATTMKSLRSTGTSTARAHRGQVVEAAAEPAPLGEHADDGGAAGLVVGGQRGGSAIAASAPLDGLDRLTSAMTATPSPREQRRRCGSRAGPAARALSSSRLTRAWRSARSARTPTRMSSSTLTRWVPSPSSSRSRPSEVSRRNRSGDRPRASPASVRSRERIPNSRLRTTPKHQQQTASDAPRGGPGCAAAPRHERSIHQRPEHGERRRGRPPSATLSPTAAADVAVGQRVHGPQRPAARAVVAGDGEERAGRVVPGLVRVDQARRRWWRRAPRRRSASGARSARARPVPAAGSVLAVTTASRVAVASRDRADDEQRDEQPEEDAGRDRRPERELLGLAGRLLGTGQVPGGVLAVHLGGEHDRGDAQRPAAEDQA